MRGFLNHASGDTDDSEDNASANEEELDFNIDFKLPEGVLRGLWLRTRAAFVDETARDA